MKSIIIRGASTHNLKKINLEIPKNQLIVVTGLSGSGKSSLAFDTLYAEGQRRYVESLSAYARQFLSVMDKPEVESIEGLSPAIAIDQKSTSHNPRSTVGTVTEIYDYLRLLFARIGKAYCPIHKTPLAAETLEQITNNILALDQDEKYLLLAPLVSNRKGTHQDLLNRLSAQGFVRIVLNNEIKRLDALEPLSAHQKHTLLLVVDRFKIRTNIQQRIRESVETALQFSPIVQVQSADLNDAKKHLFSNQHACSLCGYSMPELEPRLFSFNSPLGYCNRCQGLGVVETINPKKLITSDELSLEAGAIKGWGAKLPRRFKMLEALAKQHNFSLTAPFKSLDQNIHQFIFEGDVATGFEGIVNILQDNYHNHPHTPDTIQQLIEMSTCKACLGTRLNSMVQNVLVGEKNLPQITHFSLNDAFNFFKTLSLTSHQLQIAEKIIQETTDRLSFLIEVGLNYLSLDRPSNTLSGGEAQRIRLASQIGSGLNNVLYVLDEPSIGLHQRDNERLLNSLDKLKKLDNTVLIIEHDQDTMKRADHIIDIGPGAGIHGGQIVAEGNFKKICQNPHSLTGQYLSGKKQTVGLHKKKHSDQHLTLEGACGNNLKNLSIKVPIGALTVVSGVSGSGKSTLINRTFYPAFANQINQQHLEVSPFEKISGFQFIKRVIDIDQSPIGRTPRSNPATYTGLFNDIRELFAGTKEAKSRGYKIGRFSFNVKGGRCEVCSGDGVKKIEMLFMADVYVPCDICKGKRYNPDTLEVQYKDKNIYQVLNMTIEDALVFFNNIPKIKRKLSCLVQVGLGYLQIGQRATTLSGGEAQRVKLAKELSRKDIGNTLYILDEPTTGLHFDDIHKLMEIIFKLRDNNNTIVIIEHNLDVIRAADWIIDLGPEGGGKGGELLFCNPSNQFSRCQNSYTAQFLYPRT